MFLIVLGLVLINLHDSFPIVAPNIIERWDEISKPSLAQSNQILNKPFRLSVSCSASTIECKAVETVATIALEILASKSIFLKETVSIKMEYKSFCLETNNCKNDSGEYTLGSASPVAFHTFDPVYARELGLDPNYSYPSALARQYIPHGDLPDHDISIRMNSDVNWAFAGANLNESFMDFKQIFLHETLHGLGILTSWSSETIPGMILPGSFKYENRAITGFQESGIFDKFMFDQVTRVWLSTYAAAIRADANIVSSRLNTRDKLAWTREFRKTQGARLAELLFSKAMGIAFLG